MRPSVNGSQSYFTEQQCSFASQRDALFPQIALLDNVAVSVLHNTVLMSQNALLALYQCQKSETNLRSIQDQSHVLLNK